MRLFYPSLRYFLAQNAAIKKKKIEGIHINLKTLGIGNGLTVSCSFKSLHPIRIIQMYVLGSSQSIPRLPHIRNFKSIQHSNSHLRPNCDCRHLIHGSRRMHGPDTIVLQDAFSGDLFGGSGILQYVYERFIFWVEWEIEPL